MTFPLKEQLVYFEKLEGLQSQVYADACDTGIPLIEIDEKEYKANISALMKFYGYEATKWSTGKKVQIFIPFEYATMDTYRGVTLEVARCYDPTPSGEDFIAIHIYQNQYRDKANIPSVARSTRVM